MAEDSPVVGDHEYTMPEIDAAPMVVDAPEQIVLSTPALTLSAVPSTRILSTYRLFPYRPMFRKAMTMLLPTNVFKLMVSWRHCVEPGVNSVVLVVPVVLSAEPDFK